MKKLLVLSLVLVFAGLSSGAIEDNLVIHMAYDEGAGSVTHDSSGNGYDGTLYYGKNDKYSQWTSPGASAWTSEGKFGSAIKLYNDGEQSIIDTHVLSEDNYTLDVSISFWAKRPETRHFGQGSGWASIWTLTDGWYVPGDESSVDWWNWGTIEYDMVHQRVDTWAPGNANRRLNTALTGTGAWRNTDLAYMTNDYGDGIWHNIVQTVQGDPWGGPADGSPNQVGTRFIVTTYVDGVEQNVARATGWGWGYTNIEAISMGGFEPLKGITGSDEIDDYGVWARTLTPDEIAWIASGVAPIPEPTTMTLLCLGALSLIRRKK